MSLYSVCTYMYTRVHAGVWRVRVWREMVTKIVKEANKAFPVTKHMTL